MFELLLSTGAIKIEEDNPDEEEMAMFTKKPLGWLSCASCEKKI